VSATDGSSASGRLTVLYDARCRVCTRIAGRLAGADSDRRLRLRPLQWAADDEWSSVRRLRAERDLRRALHVVDEGGDWADGGEAMLRTLERVSTLAPLARVLRWPLLATWVEPGYRWFAAHRARFAFLAGSFRPAYSAPRSASVGESRAARMAG
jgi:predicted DCC family thiol-disulfide oxidoreductase YuxK